MNVLNIKEGQHYTAKTEGHSFVDGEGIRCGVCISGRPFQCKGCYNVKAQNFKYGEPFELEMLGEILDYCAPPYIEGLSILGGEPFCNLFITLQLVEALRQRFGYTKAIWVWTDFLFEYLKQQDDARKPLLEHIDVLVDGMFIQHLYRPSLLYKGSLNQRVIDVQSSLQKEQVTKYLTK